MVGQLSDDEELQDERDRRAGRAATASRTAAGAGQTPPSGEHAALRDAAGSYAPPCGPLARAGASWGLAGHSRHTVRVESIKRTGLSEKKPVP